VVNKGLGIRQKMVNNLHYTVVVLLTGKFMYVKSRLDSYQTSRTAYWAKAISKIDKNGIPLYSTNLNRE
jgi:hypothetical protein